MVRECGFFMALSLTVMSPANAVDNLPDTLRVCAATNEMPYSNVSEKGFENEIAKVLAESMSLPLEFVWSSKAAIFLVSEHLMKNECEVVIGVDSDDPRVATSKPYYKTGYAFISRSDRNLNIESWKSPDIQNLNKFAIVSGSPSEVMLREVGKYEGNFNYQKSLTGFKSPRNKYIRVEPKKLIGEVVSGDADVAHVWVPEVARYVRDIGGTLTMQMSPESATLKNGEIVLQHYEQSVAVRTDDSALLRAVNKGLEKASDRINKILKEEGIPLL